MVNGMHYRHPAVTANAAVTVDHISGGRFSLGLGAGWFEPESNAYGIPLGTLTERFDRFDEGVEVISLAAHQRGHHLLRPLLRSSPTRAATRSRVQARLPIVIGGKGPKRTLRTVARWADHWDVAGATDAGQWKALDATCLALRGDRARPGEIKRSVHLMWPADADPSDLADRAASFGERRRRPRDLLDARPLRGPPPRTPRRRPPLDLTPSPPRFSRE